MSQPPNSSDSSHARRASTHSISVSYAYGSPSIGSPGPPLPGGMPAPPRGSPRSNHASYLSTDGRAPSVISGSTAMGDDDTDEPTGRPRESAQVRYQRIKQRKRDTGSAFLPHQPPPGEGEGEGAEMHPPPAPVQAPAALRGEGGGNKVPVGRNDTSVNIATAFAQATRGAGGVVQGQRREVRQEEEVEEGSSGEEDGVGAKETHVAGSAAGDGNSKKRKKRTSKDPSFKPSRDDEELDSDEALGEGLARGKAKRTKTAVPDEEQEQAPDSGTTSQLAATKKGSRRKSGDAAYRPTATSDVETESDDSEPTRRRRSKGKGKGRASDGTNATARGRVDNEVWNTSKKRKGRKGGRRNANGEEEEGEDEEEEDFGGHDDQSFDVDVPDADDAPAPAASFFLRPKSPPPSAPTYQGHTLQSSPVGHPPFLSSRAATNPDPDPAFRSFDRSLNNSRANRSDSVDDSGVRGSSYDYSEEERIVAALEREKLANASGRNLAGTSDPSSLRKRNRMPAPPVRGPFLGGIEEEEPVKSGRVGRTVGALLRPVWGLFVKIWRVFQNPLVEWGAVFKALALGLAVLFLLVLVVFQPSSTPQTPSTGRSFADYIPLYFSKPTYAIPDLPAQSLEQLVNRLSMLEKAMGQLSSISEGERARAERDRKLVGKITDQVFDLETSLDTERKRATKALQGSDSANAKEAREIEKTVVDLRGVLDGLVDRVKVLSSDRQADASDIAKLQHGVEAVGKDIASLGTKVAQVSMDVQAGVDAERISKIALEAIEARLPSKLAVRLDSNGKMEIDPAFWKHLRDAFAEKKDVDALVSSKVAAELAKRPIASGSYSAPPPPVVVTKEPSWEDFLVANEASLRSWVNSDINSRVGSDAIVSRKTFLDILHREIKTLKVDFEAKSNENVQKIGQELLEKVAKQEAMKKRPAAAPAQPQQPGVLTIKSADGKDISSVITSIVDSALLRYSKDVLARPDYALAISGGHVIPVLTSSTYVVKPAGLVPKLVSWVTASGPTPGNSPITALIPGLQCWPFPGQEGNLGILLSRRVVPSDITLEHISRDIAPDADVSSAPKDFEVWGVVEGREEFNHLLEFRREQAASKSRGREAGEEIDDNEEITSVPSSPQHMLLVAGQYDVTSPSPVQTFPVVSSARQLGIPVSIVLVKFLSNNGNPAFTCVYRVRVHGASEAVLEAAAAAVAPSSD